MPEVRGIVRGKVKWRKIAHLLRECSEQIGTLFKPVFVVVGLLLVVALEIPWLQPLYKRFGFDSLESLGVPVITFILVLVYFDVRSMSVRQVSPSDRHFADPLSLHAVLEQRMRRITRREEKTLDVLGIDLSTISPLLTPWFRRREMDGWTVQLCAMVDELGVQQNFVPSDWSSESRKSLDRALNARDELVASGRKIDIRTYAYDFMPVVHGFRLGNGDLFVSTLSWDKNGRIGGGDYSYEHVPCEDESPSAMATREVFSSWFNRAISQAWPGNVVFDRGEPRVVQLSVVDPDQGASEPVQG
jgi:hypothetical protein